MLKVIGSTLAILAMLTLGACTKTLEEKMDSANQSVNDTNRKLDEVNKGIGQTNGHTKELGDNQALQTAYLTAINPDYSENVRTMAAAFYLRHAPSDKVRGMVGTLLPIEEGNIRHPQLGNFPNVTVTETKGKTWGTDTKIPVVNENLYTILDKASRILVDALASERPNVSAADEESFSKDVQRAVFVATAVFGARELAPLDPRMPVLVVKGAQKLSAGQMSERLKPLADLVDHLASGQRENVQTKLKTLVAQRGLPEIK
ncbi:MAG: hypothetical protein HY537_10490 [Deltaproteobacteria bacterium]|nr:hypothetical protein [Deltaproteobacteria bacterium]